MGNPSSLLFVPASIANIPIDWTRVPEASKKELARWNHDWEKKVTKPLPTTVGKLAKWFDESKFFGYFDAKLCTLIMDISEFGLKATPGQAMPRFYMKYLEKIWFLLFTPGSRECIMGYSEDIARDGEDKYERWTAEEVDIAKKFDARFERSVSDGVMTVMMVKFYRKLAGWNALTLEASLQTAQLSEAMFTLPDSHPARAAFFSSMFRNL